MSIPAQTLAVIFSVMFRKFMFELAQTYLHFFTKIISSFFSTLVAAFFLKDYFITFFYSGQHLLPQWYEVNYYNILWEGREGGRGRG